MQLSSVYTALLTEGRPENPMAAAGRGDAGPPHEGEQRVSALEALDREQFLVLMGGPGSGKTTFLNFVVLCLAGELLRSPAAGLELLCRPIPPEPDAGATASTDAEARPQRWTHGALLPVRVVLRDFAASLPPPGTPANADMVWDFIVGQLPALLGRYADHLQAELLGHGGLILLDGLDEVPDALSRREQVKQAVQDFAGLYRNCRFLVTSRTYAYQRQDWKLDGFAERELLPFTRGQIERFIDGWYAHMAHDLYRLTETDATARAAVLKRATERPELRELAERPLLLTLMARLQTKGGGALPENREELYGQSVDMLLDEWEGLKLRRDTSGQPLVVEPSLSEWLNASRENIRRELDKLAYDAHRNQPELVGTADIRQDALINALLAASRERPDTRPLRIEEYLRDRAGLLTSHGEGLYQFPHRSFQEFLAACHLTRFDYPDTLSRLARSDPNRWREVTLLAAARSKATPTAVWELVEELCARDEAPAEGKSEADEEAQWGALLAGQVLHETGLAAPDANLQERHERKRLRVRDWQLRLLNSTLLPARERALAGDLLATLGDTRAHLLEVDRMRFTAVPRGGFWMGDEGSQDVPLHRNETLDYDYWISETPVTVAQFAEFIAASAYDNHHPAALRQPQNRPVAWVSWHDARAFCAWLTERWRSVLPTGWGVLLPSEAEWEKAARGGVQIPVAVQHTTARGGFTLAASALQTNPQPQREYPWGDDWNPDKANAENGVGETSTPSCFAPGHSPYGCEDLAGNVWEWTRSNHASYPYDARDLKREDPRAGENRSRVVRGGSWGFPRGFARCASRGRYRPGFRRGGFGFRVALRSSPVR